MHHKENAPVTDPIPVLPAPDGATRLHLILGDPIAQVKAPGGVSRVFAARGRNAVLLPAHVAPGAPLDAFLRGADAIGNLDGLVATVPHKFAAFRHCAMATERARILRSANVLRRNGDGTWHGDMTDGLGMVGGLRAAGFDPAGRRALLVGAGGAGSAIALALAEAGVAVLAVHDADAARRDELLRGLAGARRTELRAGSPDPAGFDLVVNATPAGMRPEDPLPVLADRLDGRAFVADVITAPEYTPLLHAARALGCGTQTGVGMFTAQVELIADFLLGE
jgi:shikimate dehydrogenase